MRARDTCICQNHTRCRTVFAAKPHALAGSLPCECTSPTAHAGARASLGDTPVPPGKQSNLKPKTAALARPNLLLLTERASAACRRRHVHQRSSNPQHEKRCAHAPCMQPLSRTAAQVHGAVEVSQGAGGRTAIDGAALEDARAGVLRVLGQHGGVEAPARATRGRRQPLAVLRHVLGAQRACCGSSSNLCQRRFTTGTGSYTGTSVAAPGSSQHTTPSPHIPQATKHAEPGMKSHGATDTTPIAAGCRAATSTQRGAHPARRWRAG